MATRNPVKPLQSLAPANKKNMGDGTDDLAHSHPEWMTRGGRGDPPGRVSYSLVRASLRSARSRSVSGSAVKRQRDATVALLLKRMTSERTRGTPGRAVAARVTEAQCRAAVNKALQIINTLGQQMLVTNGYFQLANRVEVLLLESRAKYTLKEVHDAWLGLCTLMGTYLGPSDPDGVTPELAAHAVICAMGARALARKKKWPFISKYSG